MQKFFLDKFSIQNIVPATNGNLHLHCQGIYKGKKFTFNFYVTDYEFTSILESLKETGKKIQKVISGGFFSELIQILRKAVLVDSCWLTIKVIELSNSDDLDREYYVDNYGFIPE